VLLDGQWLPVRQALEALAQGRHDTARNTAFDQHTQQVDAMRERVRAAAEKSGLLLDPEAHSYFLMDVAVERLLPWTETLGRVRGEGAGLLARGDASSAALVDREAAGGGWIDYAIVNPVSGQVQAQASWVQQLDDGLVIGCGIYRDTAAAASSIGAAAPASAPRAPAGRKDYRPPARPRTAAAVPEAG
jgi:hypothetical protein